MRVMVVIENRFLRSSTGVFYSTTNCDYAFWSRYLKVFDEVVVFARVLDIPEATLDKPPANGPNVSFCPVPMFIGPRQFLKQYSRICSLAKDAIGHADTFILRTPGSLSFMIGRHLQKRQIPYGVEVVADPWEVMRHGNIKTIARPLLRFLYRRKLVRQCERASTAAYVTEHTLQKSYPAKCWSTHYSSIELPKTMIIDDEALAERIRVMRERIGNGDSLRIVNLAGMTCLYKGQNILIEAVSICRKRGLDIRLTLMGDGRCKDTYVKLVGELGLSQHVTFLGHVQRGDATNEQLDAADLFVFPSFTEGLPRGVIDAMARGLPCISTDVGGVPELLRHEDLVSPREAEKLADKIESVARDPERLERMARRNVRESRKYQDYELEHRRIEHFKMLRAITEDYLSKHNAAL